VRKSIIGRVPVLEPGAKLPALELSDERGAPVAPSEGETLYVVFKTTCPTCALTWPYLERIGRAAEGGRLRVLGISQDDPQETRDFERRVGACVTAAYDRPPYPASDALGVSTVPTLLRVAGDGTVAETVIGFDRARLESLARRAADLAGRPPVPLFGPDENVPALKPG
jgi:thiol-disulfide isomerase/thioredoxin